MIRLRLPRVPQQRLGEPEQADDRHDGTERRQHGANPAVAHQPQQREDDHQRDADRQRRRAEAVGDLQRRCRDVAFLIGVFVGRRDDHQEEGECGAGPDDVEKRPHPRTGRRHQRGHPHMLAAPERHGGAEHRQPQEQDRGQFVRPDQRAVEAVTRDHADEQDDHLRHHQQRRRNLDQMAEGAVDGGQDARRGGRGRTPSTLDAPLSRAEMSCTAIMVPISRACRRLFPGWPRLRRRTCPSIRHRSRPG